MLTNLSTEATLFRLFQSCFIRIIWTLVIRNCWRNAFNYSLTFSPIRKHRPILELHSRFLIPLNAVRRWLVEILFFFLKFYFCDWNTAFVHAFLFLDWLLNSASSIDGHLFLAFKALSAAFSWSFSIYFFFSRATVGTWWPWNWSQSSAGSPKTKCLLQTRSLCSTLLFVASPRLTAEIQSFLL